MKRLVIYAYNNESGVVGKATEYLLRQLDGVSDRLVVVCNAFLTPQGRKTLKSITEDAYCLNFKNEIPVLYADALMQYLGMDCVLHYDEVTLMDDSFFGPFWPLKEIYDQMEYQNCDYWRLTPDIALQRFSVLRKGFIERETYVSYMNCLLGNYRRNFQKISVARKPVSKDSYVEDIYDGQKEGIYFEQTEETKKWGRLDRQFYLMKERKYPFLNKDFFDELYWDVVKENSQYDLKKTVLEFEEEKQNVFDLINEERNLQNKFQKTYDKTADVLYGNLFVDCGSGYTEANRFSGYTFVNNNGDFQIRFLLNVQRPVCGIRYDPLEKIPNLAMRLTGCRCDGNEATLISNNGIDWAGNYQVFSTDDPFYEYRYEANNVNEVVITGNMLFLSNAFMDVLSSHRATPYLATFFWDYGNGYSEACKLVKGVCINEDGEFELNIGCELKNIKGFRYDPIEGFKCCVRLDKFRMNDKPVDVRRTNGKKTGRREWTFDTFDPSMIMDIHCENIYSIHVQGRIILK
ncbi:MAG: rhamnan synthesis F family protein [Lachnospiraceae bacterium]|nr:rhamnan synthesis F family protein [Lachnospiraceae bacterium]